MNTKNIKVGSPVQAGPRAGVVLELKPAMQDGNEIAKIKPFIGKEFSMNTCYLDLMDEKAVWSLWEDRQRAANDEAQFLKNAL